MRASFATIEAIRIAPCATLTPFTLIRKVCMYTLIHQGHSSSHVTAIDPAALLRICMPRRLRSRPYPVLMRSTIKGAGS